MTPCLNIQVDESGIKKPSKPVKVDAECQATEETMYDFQPSVFSDLPKDRFLERSMFKNLEEDDVVLGEGPFQRW